MRDRVPTYPGRVQLTPVPGQPNIYDLTMADEPTEVGTPPTKANLLSDETAGLLGLDGDPTVNDALRRLSGVRLLYEKYTAGTVDFTVPSGVTKIGVLLIGGGGSGQAARDTGSSVALRAGASGELIQFPLNVTPGAVLSGVIGAGGVSVQTATSGASSYMNGLNGGGSSFAGKVALGGGGALSSGECLGGQSSELLLSAASGAGIAPLGGVPVRNSNQAQRNLTGVTINLFDPSDKHIWCGAGAGIWDGAPQSVLERARGTAGAAAKVTTGHVTAPAATAPGDGGGVAYVQSSTTSYRATSGAGAPGCILIYNLTGREAASV